MLILTVIDRATAAIDCELKIVEMELEHPERFVYPVSTQQQARWLGTNSDITELAIPLHQSQLICGIDGHPMSLAEIIDLIRPILGISEFNPYTLKSKIMMRKKNDAPFLERLLKLYRTEVEKSLL